MRIDQTTPARQLPITAAPPEQNLSKTDWKTHALVVLGYVLVAIGIALAFCAPYIAFTVQPMLAVASPVLPIALGVLGIQYASEPLSPVKVAAPVKPSNVVVVPPIGIANKSGNCWINSSLQLLFNVPAYRRVMENLLENTDPKLSIFRDAYKTHNEGGHVDSQKIREWLHKLNPREVSLNSSQQLCYEICLSAILLKVGYSLPKEIRHQITREGERANSVSVAPLPTSIFDISTDFIDENANNNVTDALNHYFYKTEPSNIEDETGKVIRKRTLATILTLDSKPEDFSISVDFSKTLKKKDVKELQGAMEVSLSRQLGNDADYFCDGFIRHSGSGTGYGHYIAYFLKDGKWWEASDSDVGQMDLKEVNEQLAKASYIHYQKKPVTQALT